MLVFILTTLGLGVLCSIPGIILGKWMVAKGVVQEEISVKWMIGSTIVSFFVLRFLLPQASLVWIIIGASVMWWGLYKSDLWTTFFRGRWWWQKNPEPLTLLEQMFSFLVIMGSMAIIVVLAVIMDAMLK